MRGILSFYSLSVKFLILMTAYQTNCKHLLSLSGKHWVFANPTVTYCILRGGRIISFLNRITLHSCYSFLFCFWSNGQKKGGIQSNHMAEEGHSDERFGAEKRFTVSLRCQISIGSLCTNNATQTKQPDPRSDSARTLHLHQGTPLSRKV